MNSNNNIFEKFDNKDDNLNLDEDFTRPFDLVSNSTSTICGRKRKHVRIFSVQQQQQVAAPVAHTGQLRDDTLANWNAAEKLPPLKEAPPLKKGKLSDKIPPRNFSLDIHIFCERCQFFGIRKEFENGPSSFDGLYHLKCPECGAGEWSISTTESLLSRLQKTEMVAKLSLCGGFIALGMAFAIIGLRLM